jgi:hypothetical protein
MHGTPVIETLQLSTPPKYDFNDRFALLPTTFGKKRRQKPYKIGKRAKRETICEQSAQHQQFVGSVNALKILFKANETKNETLQSRDEMEIVCEELKYIKEREQSFQPQRYFYENVQQFQVRVGDDLFAHYAEIIHELDDLKQKMGEIKRIQSVMSYNRTIPIHCDVTTSYVFQVDQNLAVEILKRCDLDTIGRMSQLNKWWKKICQNELVWRELWEHYSAVYQYKEFKWPSSVTLRMPVKGMSDDESQQYECSLNPENYKQEVKLLKEHIDNQIISNVSNYLITGELDQPLAPTPHSAAPQSKLNIPAVQRSQQKFNRNRQAAASPTLGWKLIMFFFLSMIALLTAIYWENLDFI